MTACAHQGPLSVKKALAHVSPKERLDAIRRAQVWAPTDVPSMDLKTGPKGSGAFERNDPLSVSRQADEKKRAEIVNRSCPS